VRRSEAWLLWASGAALALSAGFFVVQHFRFAAVMLAVLGVAGP
jgi:hypothetical protein